ncbi:MAG TPA: hypothetical protein VL129_05855 [Pseudomonas sp.]|uniref:hypothetical protein n=1 Tax=Pseudomonas sp. TaxID=306 RepID=UPI002C54A278|nr:hypothetical protein [Pseudomonas sp.]HTO18657.1 hypothetical protein [Pseudomonas sp.]
MNICFVANFYKTYFFHEVAKCLEKQDVNIFWIVVNRKLFDFLCNHYPKERILYINKLNSKSRQPIISEFKLNELIYGDRVLRYEGRWAKDYLRNIQKPFSDFVKENCIKFVFGETTWAHEILFHRLLDCNKDMGAQYLCPHTIRIPNGRFAFFKDEYQSEFYEVGSSLNYRGEQVSFEVAKPDYLKINDKRVSAARSFKSRVDRVRRYITRENIDPLDPTVTVSRWVSFRKNASEELNRDLIRFVNFYKFTEQLSRQKYIFIALHKQPEASIDVIGRYYDDQFSNILNVWRGLPDGWKLLVKEHSNAIGDRSLAFYRNISRLADVILIDPKEDSHSLIRNANFVITVSGTVAYEAALLGVKALTFSPCFFNKFSMCKKLDLELLRTSSLLEVELEAGNDCEVKNYIVSNSFCGKIGDPNSDPSCVDPDNIKNVADSFIKLLGLGG